MSTEEQTPINESESNESGESSVESSAVKSEQTSKRLPRALLLEKIQKRSVRGDIIDFRSGDTVKVHAKVVEGTKERVQIFEGIVLKRQGRNSPGATFTVRKVSFNNISVERTFRVHSPRIEKIELVARGEVRRSRLYYLRPLRGKAARVKRKLDFTSSKEQSVQAAE